MPPNAGIDDIRSGASYHPRLLADFLRCEPVFDEIDRGNPEEDQKLGGPVARMRDTISAGSEDDSRECRPIGRCDCLFAVR